MLEHNCRILDAKETEAQIRQKVAMVVADERNFGALSPRERIAVAVVLNRYDLLERCGTTIAESISRLGDSWRFAALHVQKQGWVYADSTGGAHEE